MSYDAGTKPPDLDRQRGDAVWGCAAVALLAIALYFVRPLTAVLWNASALVLPSAATVLFINAVLLAPLAALPILVRGVSPLMAEILFRWLERRSARAAQFVQILPPLGLACLLGGYIAACAGYAQAGIVVATLPWWGVVFAFVSLYRTRIDPPSSTTPPMSTNPPSPAPPSPVANRGP